MTPTREQLLAASYHFEGFSTWMIRAERKGLWIMWPLAYWQIAVVVWQFPVTNWFEVFAVLINLAGAVYGFHVIARIRAKIADIVEARETARHTIAELERDETRNA